MGESFGKGFRKAFYLVGHSRNMSIFFSAKERAICKAVALNRSKFQSDWGTVQWTYS